MKRRIEKCSRVFIFSIRKFLFFCTMAAVRVFRSANGTILDEDNKKVKKYLKMVAVNLGAV